MHNINNHSYISNCSVGSPQQAIIERSPFEDLIDDMVIYILKSPDLKNDEVLNYCYSVALVNKKWSKISAKIFSDFVNLNQTPMSELFENNSCLLQCALKVGKALNFLDIWDTDIDERSFKKLINACPNLKFLALNSASVTEEGLSALGNNNALLHLVASCAHLKDMGFVAGLKNLKALELTSSPIEKGLDALKKLKALELLDLTGGSKGEIIEFPDLSKLKNLCDLRFWASDAITEHPKFQDNMHKLKKANPSIDIDIWDAIS